jgi:hypothetical protein
VSQFEPRKARWQYLYKYSNAEHLDWLHDILLNHALYFPSHPELNDPLDGWPQVRNLSVDQVTSFLVNGFIKRHPGADLGWLAHEVAVIDVNVRHHGSLRLLELMGDEIRRLAESNRIYSLSMAGESSRMWEKYGGDHNGYCLEFVNDGLFAAAREVEYDDDLIVLDSNTPTGSFFFHKTLRWKDEQEARIVMFPRGGDAFVAMFADGARPFVRFEPSLLRRIILGKNMTRVNRDKIREWAGVRNPQGLVVEEVVAE